METLNSVFCIKVLNTLQNFSICFFTETLHHSQLQQGYQNLKETRAKVLKAHPYGHVFLADCRLDDVYKPLYSGNHSWNDPWDLCYPLQYPKIEASHPCLVRF